MFPRQTKRTDIGCLGGEVEDDILVNQDRVSFEVAWSLAVVVVVLLYEEVEN